MFSTLLFAETNVDARSAPDHLIPLSDLISTPSMLSSQLSASLPLDLVFLNRSAHARNLCQLATSMMCMHYTVDQKLDYLPTAKM